MKVKWFSAVLVLFLLISPAAATSVSAAAPAITPVMVPVSAGGTASFTGGAVSSDPAIDTTEIDQATMGDTDASDGVDFGAGVNRTLPTVVTGNGRSINPNKRAKSNPALGTHFQGLNFHDQRFANGGNQFSVEPPDQALCAGGGYLFEAVNDVAQVYDASARTMFSAISSWMANTSSSCRS